MSIGGPSSLGTLLVQRLDAVLGTTLSQQANIVSGARPDAVTQPDNPASLGAAQNETLRHPRATVDQANAQGARQNPLDKARIDASRPSPDLARNTAASSSTASAPTTLGYAARTILALLGSYPEPAPAIQGTMPLATAASSAAAAQAGATGAASGAGAPNAMSSGSAAPAAATGTAPGAATGAQGPAPAGTTGIPARAFMQALSQALQTSGLFYESHLNELAFGQRNAASILPEPQAQLPASGALSGGAQPHAAAVPIAPAGSPAPSADGVPIQNPRDHAPAPAAPSQAAPTTATDPSGQLAGLHPNTHLLVRQQLEVLANQALVWRGEAWPEAAMQWEIGRRPASSGTPEAGDHWASHLALTLPRLGTVDVRLTLAGQQLVMQLLAPEAAERLSGQSAQLRSRLQESGLQLQRLSILAAEPPDNSFAAAAAP